MKINKVNTSAINLLLISGFILIAYLNSLNNEFSYDDNYLILNNPKIENINNYLYTETWFKLFSNRSLSKLTYALNFNIHGYEVWGYHLFNILIHIFSSVTVYFLSLHIIRRLSERKLSAKYEFYFALITSLIFALHPIQTDAVTYVTQRMASMAGLFVFLSLLLYIKFRDKLRGKNTKRAVTYLLLFIISFLLSILSKETGYITIIFLFLIEVLFYQKKEAAYSYKYFFIALAVLLLSLLLYVAILGFPYTTRDFTRFIYLITQQKVIMEYILILIIPINQHVSHLVKPETSLFSLGVLFPFIIHISLILSAIVLYKKGKRIITAGILWFYAALLIESSILPLPYLMNEYRLYIAIFGYSILFAFFVISWASVKKTKIPFLLAGFVILGYFSLTLIRNNVWQDEITLWTDNVEKSPDNPEGFNALGYTYSKKGDKIKALSLLNRAVELKPDYLQARLNRGVVLFDLMKDDEALTDFNFILERTPANFLALCNKGAIFARKGEMDEAKIWFDKSIAANPHYYRSHYDIGLYYYTKGNLDSALISFTKSVNLNRIFEKGYNNRAVIHLEKKNYAESMKDLDTALKIKPLYFDAILNKAIVLRDLKDYNLSLYYHNLALALSPKNERAFFERSLTFIRTKEYEFAIRDLESCIVINPYDKKYEQMIKQLRVMSSN